MSDTRIFYQWMRFEVMDQWWHWIVLVLAILAITSYTIVWYRRDWIELPRSLGWMLLLLRLTALVGIVIFFFDLQKRSEQRVVRPSRLAILVDTSLSMSLPIENATTSVDPRSRMHSVIEFFTNSALLTQLRSAHDVAVYRFDQSQRPTLVAALAKPTGQQMTDDETSRISTSLWSSLSRVVWAGTVFGALALIGLAIAMTARVSGSRSPAWPYVALLSAVSIVAAIAIVGTAALRGSSYPIASLWSLREPSADQILNGTNRIDGNKTKTTPSTMAAEGDHDWATLLTASGIETRIGDAIQAIIEQERGTPLSGIVILTDGQSNSGVDPISAAAMAMAANVPIYAIGLGDPDDPINVRLVDVEAPKRVYPGDRFRVTALVQASGLAGKKCAVQLRRRSAGTATDTPCSRTRRANWGWSGRRRGTPKTTRVSSCVVTPRRGQRSRTGQRVHHGDTGWQIFWPKVTSHPLIPIQ